MLASDHRSNPLAGSVCRWWAKKQLGYFRVISKTIKPPIMVLALLEENTGKVRDFNDCILLALERSATLPFMLSCHADDHTRPETSQLAALHHRHHHLHGSSGHHRRAPQATHHPTGGVSEEALISATSYNNKTSATSTTKSTENIPTCAFCMTYAGAHANPQ